LRRNRICSPAGQCFGWPHERGELIERDRAGGKATAVTETTTADIIYRGYRYDPSGAIFAGAALGLLGAGIAAASPYSYGYGYASYYYGYGYPAYYGYPGYYGWGW